MDIIIPSSLTQYKLYQLAEKVIKDYQLDEVNLDEFPIMVFNKLVESLGYELNPEMFEELNRIFTEKGSYNSIISLFRIFGISCNINAEQAPSNIVININVSEVTNTDFVKYVSECLSYLIFYDELILTIKSLIFKVTLKSRIGISLIGLNVQFDAITL